MGNSSAIFKDAAGKGFAFNEEEIRKLWQVYDADGSGELDRKETQKFLKEFLGAVSDARDRELDELIKVTKGAFSVNVSVMPCPVCALVQCRICKINQRDEQGRGIFDGEVH